MSNTTTNPTTVNIRMRAYDGVGRFKFWFDVQVRDGKDIKELKHTANAELKRVREQRRVRTLGVRTLRFDGGEILL